MENIFIPFKGTNFISFGMQRNVVRELLQNTYKVFTRNQFSENTTDYYDKLGMFISYTKEDICDAIEFSSDSNFFYNGYNLIEFRYDDLRSHFDPQSKNYDDDDGGITYYDLGFGVSRNYETNKVESISIFSKNYW